MGRLARFIRHSTAPGAGLLRVVLALVMVASAQSGAAHEQTPAARERLGLEQPLAAHPNQIDAMQALAAALLAQVRVAPRAADLARAETLIERLLAVHAPRAEALNAWRLLIAHRFDEALGAARRARADGVDPLLAAVSEADALTELGRYNEAEITVQYLLDHHYGIAALARASHLRMVFGDLPGAIELATRALADSQAGVDRAWLQLDLAELQLMAGAPATALTLAITAVADLPAAALAMQARAQHALGNRPAALALYRVAAAHSLRAETLLEIRRLARALGEHALATRTEAVLDGMARLDTVGAGSDRRSFVEFYLERGDVTTAETLARAEWRQRPDVYGAAQLAWVLYREDKISEAQAYAAYAVGQRTPDPLLQWRAGVVLAANGEARGKALMATALAHDARLSGSAASLAARR